MIAWFTRNPVAANLLMLFILGMGFLAAAPRLPLEFFPAIETDLISVKVSYFGATPEDIERSITTRVEESVADLDGIEKITSYSREGLGEVLIDAEDRYDVQKLFGEVKPRVDSISTLPADAEKPTVQVIKFQAPIITVFVSGPFQEKEVREQAEMVRDDLGALPGVGLVEMNAVRSPEIIIEVSQDKLREYSLSIADVARTVDRNSSDVSAGNLRTEGGDVLLRGRGQAYSRSEFERLVVRTDTDGSIIRVSDVATVRDVFEETNLRIRYNGEPAVFMVIRQGENADVIKVAERVKAYARNKQQTLPQGMHINTWDDNSEATKGRLRTLVRNAVQGGLLVILLLALFLRPNVAFWVFLGLPVSFAGALSVLWLVGGSLNLISLFAFILVIGVVVDDAIITGENIYRHIQRNGPGELSAIRGTKEVVVPVTFGVLSTVAAFAPMFFAGGTRGVFFMQLPLVVIPALLFSLIETKFILPAHMRDSSADREQGGRFARLLRFQRKFNERFDFFVSNAYRPFLVKALRNRYLTLSLFVSALIITLTLGISGWVRFIFLPRVDSDIVRITLTMPEGTPFSVIDRHIQGMTLAAEELQERYTDSETGESTIRHIFSGIGADIDGGRRGYGGQVAVEMPEESERAVPVSSREILAEWKALVGLIPGAEEVNYRADFGDGGKPIRVQFYSNNLDQLKQAATELRSHLATFDHVFTISDDYSSAKEELRINLLPEAYALGLTQSGVSSQVRQGVYGYEAQRFQRGRNDVKVKVRFPRGERESLTSVRNIPITTPSGRQVPLEQVAELKPDIGLSTITRINRFRTITVSADMDKEQVNGNVLQRNLSVWLDQMITRYPGLRYKFEGELEEQSETLAGILLGLVFTLAAIYCMLAIPFRSYSQPFIVMSVIPFGIIGAFIGHMILGKTISILSIFGFLALMGVVVNDALVLVDFINRGHKGNIMRAVIRAGTMRFRPVLLTSTTTFMGLLPIMFDKSTQAQFLIPMAITLAFGVLFASFVTLLLVPANYMILADIKRYLAHKRREWLPALG